MSKKIFLLFVFISSIIQAQHTIKGTMTSPQSDDWVILYKIEGAKQVFINNTTVKNDTIIIDGDKKVISHFEFSLPENSKKGSYRATYALNGAGFVDFLFNNENVSFIFNPAYPEESITFSESKENIMYGEYLEDVNIKQQKLDSLQIVAIQTPNDSISSTYKKILQSVNDVQNTYMQKSKGMLVHHFIKATQRKNAPEVNTSMQDYLSSFVNTFFDNMDFSDEVLFNSSFLVDRIVNYIFDLHYSDDVNSQQKLYKESIATVMTKITDVKFKKDVSEFLITQFEGLKNAEIVDYIFDNYYKKLPETIQDKEFLNASLEKLATEIGRTAPDFSWKEGEQSFKLSTLEGSDNYVLVFWSTSCSHCLREIPQLYEFMKSKANTKVIAYALEENDIDWKNSINSLTGWHNVLGLGKWENKTARTYQVFSTPTYIILDANKKIIAKPEAINDVKLFFSNH